MPSVASEPNAVLPPRPYPPSARSQTADAGQTSSPFAEMLDSAATASAPPPPRSSQPDRTAQADASKPADDGKAHAASAADSTKGSADAKPSKTGSDAAGAQDAAAPTDDEAGKLTELGLGMAKLAPAMTEAALTGAAKADAAEAAADGKTKEDADAAKLDCMLDDALAAMPAPVAEAAPQPVAVTIALPVAAAPIAPPSTDPMEADALASLPVAAQQTGATKPGSVEGGGKDAPQAKGAVSAESQAKGAAPADPQGQSTTADLEAKAAGPQPAVPRAASDNEEQPHEDTTKEPTAVRHLAADALAKPDAVAPSQGQADPAAAVKASAAAVANLGVAGQSHQPNGAAPPPAVANAAAQAPAAAVPLAGLAVEIATQSHAGKNHFEIRLDPPELGRIDVRLHIDRDGNISTRMIAERSDTLDLLKRDAQGLERALQQAGLKTSDNALQFSLRQQQTFTRDDTPRQTAAQLVVPYDDPVPLETLQQRYGRLLGLGGGLDIRV